MKKRVIRFAQDHDRLPTTVDELPKDLDTYNGVLDGWQRPITMTVNGSRVTFTSLGRDGAPGGADEDADIIGEFDARREDGTWQDESVKWTREPLY